jgi:hypothetical protein
MITMDFTEGGRILGFTGCNRYFGNVTIVGDTFSLVHPENLIVSNLGDSRTLSLRCRRSPVAMM